MAAPPRSSPPPPLLSHRPPHHSIPLILPLSCSFPVSGSSGCDWPACLTCPKTVGTFPESPEHILFPRRCPLYLSRLGLRNTKSLAAQGTLFCEIPG